MISFWNASPFLFVGLSAKDKAAEKSERMGRMRTLVRSAGNHSAAEVFDLAVGNGTVV